MVHLIDKSALITEIDKAIDEPAPSHDQQCPWEDGYYCGLYKAESIIDALEVKEVNLEKHLKEDIEDVFFDLYGVAVIGATSYLTVEDIKDIAKHFFKLGLRAQKEE